VIAARIRTFSVRYQMKLEAHRARLAAVPPARPSWASMALDSCFRCHGAGVLFSRQPCVCVARAIFRACLGRYRSIGIMQEELAIWGHKGMEFRADFELIARRELDAWEYRVFDLHLLQRRDWRECAARLRVDRGNFFHAVYRIERQLGRVFRELRPYALFPVDEYFS